MKAEISLPPELVDAIANRVIERLKPLIARNGKQEDVIFDVEGLAHYLKVSKQWIYERTHLKEIPHIKINGQLRFRKTDIDSWLGSGKVPVMNENKKILKVIK